VSQENVDIVRRSLAKINEGDFDAALADVAAGAELDWSASEGPDSGVYRGPAEWRKFLTSLLEAWTDLRLHQTEVIDVPPDTVVAVGRTRLRGRASGVEVAAFGAFVWTLRDGQVTSQTMYQTRDQALKAVGLEE
jgi:ketosteroid isomerase-like protein